MVLSITLLGKYVHFPLSFFFCMISSVCIVMEVQLLTQLSRKNGNKIVLSLQLNIHVGVWRLFFWYL